MQASYSLCVQLVFTSFRIIPKRYLCLIVHYSVEQTSTLQTYDLRNDCNSFVVNVNVMNAFIPVARSVERRYTMRFIYSQTNRKTDSITHQKMKNLRLCKESFTCTRLYGVIKAKGFRIYPQAESRSKIRKLEMCQSTSLFQL